MLESVSNQVLVVVGVPSVIFSPKFVSVLFLKIDELVVLCIVRKYEWVMSQVHSEDENHKWKNVRWISFKRCVELLLWGGETICNFSRTSYEQLFTLLCLNGCSFSEIDYLYAVSLIVLVKLVADENVVMF